jgi:hypothetical protein
MAEEAGMTAVRLQGASRITSRIGCRKGNRVRWRAGREVSGWLRMASSRERLERTEGEKPQD